MDMYTDEMGFKYQDFLHDLQVSWHLFAFVLFVFFYLWRKQIRLFTFTELVCVS